MKKNYKFQYEPKNQPFRKTKSNKRILVKKTGKLDSAAFLGIIYSVIGMVINVKDVKTGIFYECVLGGTVITPYDNINIVAVGDSVYFLKPDGNNSQGMILKVNERKSKLSRKSVKKTDNEQIIAANIDLVLIFLSAADPYYNKRLIDRYIVSCEYNNLKYSIVINKADLMDNDYLKEDLTVYSDLGIKVYLISVEKELGLNQLMDDLKEKTALLTGPSGVGKSTFLNSVLENETQKIGAVSERTTKGKHTTSFVSMFDTKYEGRLIDSPGLREFGLWELNKNELQLFFHEFDDYRNKCKYIPCTHIHEPNCAVIEALNNGNIDLERYYSYVQIFESL